MKRIAVFETLLFIALTPFCTAQGNKIKSELDSNQLFDYQQITLDNGMDVITLEDFSCPIVAVQVWYEVGSKDERPDRQGYAHMFEHMMFKGTDRVSETDHFNLLRKVGGTCNAYTNFDRTVYYQTLPAEQIELALWLEAERMTFLKIDQQGFDTERKVVEEELRMRENKPYGNVFKKMVAEVFAEHPYRWTPIGRLADLRATSMAELRQFWIDNYVPNNATLIIVGAVKHKQAQSLAKKYFGWIPAGPQPKRIRIEESQPTEAKSIVIDDENAPAGQTLLVWRTVPTGHPDETVLDFLSQILGTGNSSRLYRALVAESQVAVEAGVWAYNLQLDGLFGAEATLAPDSDDYEAAMKALINQIERIQIEGITDEELEKARNQMLKSQVTSNLEIKSKAQLLGVAAVTLGDVSRVNRFIDEIRSVRKEDVQRAANEYLKMDRAFKFTIKQNAGMQHARKDNEDAAITAEPELEAPAPGRGDLERPRSFPATAPINKKMASSFDLQYKEAKLTNGLKVLVVPNHEVPFVSVKLGLIHGAWTDDKPGTAAMAAKMLTRGTAEYTESQLAEAMDQAAISIEDDVDLDTASIQMDCLKEKLDTGMKLLSQVVLEPAFEQGEFDKLLQQTISGLNIKEQNPEYLAEKNLYEILFEEHPYARPVQGSSQDVKQLTAGDLKQWWKTYAQPEFATLVFAGDITKQQALELADEHFGQWGPVAMTAPAISDIPKAKPTMINIVNRPGSEQAQIQVGQFGITRHQQPDYFTGLLCGAYFGGSFHSRLNESIRVERGLTYGAWGGYRAKNLAGTFEISTFTKNESVAETIRVILDQLDKFRTVEPSDNEFYDTRSYFVGSFAGHRETPQDIARDLWLIESQGLGKDYFKKLFKGLENADKQACVDLAKKTIDTDTLAIVVVGDAEKLKEPLAAIAPVKVIEQK